MDAVCKARSSRPLLFVVVIAALVTTGCNSKGVISGTVRSKGQLVKSGNVFFYGDDGEVKGSGPISPEGTYTTGKTPVGEMTVCVLVTKPPTQAGRVKPPDQSAREGGAGDVKMPTASTDNYVPVNIRYSDPKSSDKKYTVKAGSQTYDIELD